MKQKVFFKKQYNKMPLKKIQNNEAKTQTLTFCEQKVFPDQKYTILLTG